MPFTVHDPLVRTSSNLRVRVAFAAVSPMTSWLLFSVDATAAMSGTDDSGLLTANAITFNVES